MNEGHKETVEKMIRIYCKKKHKIVNNLCVDCNELLEYAHLRLEKCLYGNDKPECKHCLVHCYKPVMKERIKNVMQFVGSRLMFYDPIMFIKYIGGKVTKDKKKHYPHKKEKADSKK